MNTENNNNINQESKATNICWCQNDLRRVSKIFCTEPDSKYPDFADTVASVATTLLCCGSLKPDTDNI